MFLKLESLVQQMNEQGEWNGIWLHACYQDLDDLTSRLMMEEARLNNVCGSPVEDCGALLANKFRRPTNVNNIGWMFW